MDYPIRTWLEERRAETGLSRPKFARQLGVNVGLYYRWVSDDPYEHVTPTPASCERIAAALGVDLDLMLEVAGHRPRREQEAESRVSYELLRRMERMQALMDAGYPKPLLLAVLDANISMAEANAASPPSQPPVKPTKAPAVKHPARRLDGGFSGPDDPLTVPYSRESVAA